VPLPTIRFSLAPYYYYLSEAFLGREAIQGQFWRINGLIGNEAAAQIQESLSTIWQNHFCG
jgi:hypothetical protein